MACRHRGRHTTASRAQRRHPRSDGSARRPGGHRRVGQQLRLDGREGVRIRSALEDRGAGGGSPRGGTAGWSRARHVRVVPRPAAATAHRGPPPDRWGAAIRRPATGGGGMTLARTTDLVQRARADGHGVAAFNVITLEHAEAIALGAETTGQPAILQISENAVRFHGGRLRPIASAAVAVAEASTVPLAVHLDHVEDDSLLRQAAGTGISSAMYDASKLDYEANVAATRRAAEWARAQGLWLEAELGEIGGKDGAHAPGVRTDPDEALGFVDATSVDGLAVAVGSSHAMVERTAELDLALIGDLAAKLPVPLVLHGSSGVADEHLAAAVAAGIVKVNVGTILNVAYTRAVRDKLALDDTLVDPRKYLRPARDAIAAEVSRLSTIVAGPRA